MEMARQRNEGKRPESSDSSLQTLMSQKSVDEIELALMQVSEQCTVEVLIGWLNLTELLLSRAKLMRQSLEHTAIGWIVQHGPIDIGDIRYITGQQKVVTCTDVVECTHMVLKACGGDVEALGAYLCSRPYKYGSVCKLIGDIQFRQVFREEQRIRLVDGKVQPQLIHIDKRFVR